jgi:hypothetical protein
MRTGSEPLVGETESKVGVAVPPAKLIPVIHVAQRLDVFAQPA